MATNLFRGEVFLKLTAYVYPVKTSSHIKIPCLRQKYLKIIAYWAARLLYGHIWGAPPGTKPSKESVKPVNIAVRLTFKNEDIQA